MRGGLDAGKELFRFSEAVLCLLDKVGHHLRLGILQLQFPQAILYDRLLFGLIQNGKALAVSQLFDLHAQDLVGCGMKGPDPLAVEIGNHIYNPLPHLLGGLVGKGYSHDLMWSYPLFNQVSHPSGQDPGFSASRTRQNQTGPIAVSNRLHLRAG
jgi:hypothetical protein